VNPGDSLPRPKCEASDADPAVPAILAGSAAAIVAVGLLCGLLIMGHSRARAPEFQADDGLFQHGAGATTDIERAWREIGQAPAAVPGGYAWVDRSAGIVQVPIGRAIDLVCAEQARAAVAAKPSP
jgi:hypothetical protein